MVAMDPYTGRVLAMVGGFSFDQSQVQPRDAGAAPARLLVQALRLRDGARQRLHAVHRRSSTRRSTIDQAAGQESGGRRITTASPAPARTLRYGIEHSKNLMTVRLAQDVGMPLIAEYAKRFGVYDDMLPVLAMSLGAGETTVLRMTTAYSMFVQRRQAHQADADRPHPGPLGPDDLPPRRAPVRGLRRATSAPNQDEPR